jgi:FkbM family methyltransferase
VLSDHWLLRRLVAAKVNFQKRFLGLSEALDARDDRLLSALIASVVREDSNTVDVGAHQGKVVRQFLAAAPRGHHYAIEPIPDRARALREKFPTVEVHEVALSNRAGEADFELVVDHTALSSFHVLDSRKRGMRMQTLRVQTRRLDDLVADGMRIDFIKIDVEGAVLQVLEGAERVITRSRPHVVFEFGGPWEGYGTTCQDVHDLLVGRYGLALFGLDGSGPYDAHAFTRRLARCDLWNFVACAPPARP